MVSQDHEQCNPSPRAAVIIALTYDEEEFDNFWEYLDSTWKKHWKAVNKLAACNIRFPSEAFDLEWILANRTRVLDINNISTEDILENIPGSYEGQKWRGFTYRTHPFRSWHFVTHEKPQCNPNAEEMKEYGLIWYRIVESYGYNVHWHGLVHFVFPRPSDFVKGIFGLDDNAELTPVWGSWYSAQKYLSDQASDSIEMGDRPLGSIWVDGNNLRTEYKRLAAREGESPLYTNLFNRDYRKYLSNNSTKYSKEVVLCESSDTAIKLAEEMSKNYTRRWFVIDCKQLVFLFTKSPPPEYLGQEAVAIINIPMNSVNSVINPEEGSWLRYIPYIAFSVSKSMQ